MEKYDVIVIGLGAMGGAAAYHCAKRGQKVLGLDVNPQFHSYGSSHGLTRALRETYFESPDYVPLTQRSFELWQELEQLSGVPLLTTSGAIYVAPIDHPLLRGVRSAAKQHSLSLDNLSQDEMNKRFPGFALPKDWEGVFEGRGSVLMAESCLRAHTDLAQKHGAELRFGCGVKSWEQTASGSIIVESDADRCEAKAVILTVGPWAVNVLSDLNLPLAGRRIPVVHFEPKKADLYDVKDMSVYFWATPQGVFAGFPNFKGEGIKIMRHDVGEICTPETVRREITSYDINELENFADTYMPNANGGVRKSLVCLYTMTPDNHFVIDRHPEFKNLIYATGFSGHGFKFAPVVGEILADLTLTKKTRHRIGFLRAGRFASS